MGTRDENKKHQISITEILKNKGEASLQMIDNGLHKKHQWTADFLVILGAERPDKGHYHTKDTIARLERRTRLRSQY